MYNLGIVLFILMKIKSFNKFLKRYLLKISKKYREKYLKRWYFNATGEVLDLKNPKTFNEKIQWLKLYDSTPIKTRLADKYLVRDWIKEKIGERYLIPLLGVWDNFDEIEFDKLPDKFVLKCNHGSGYNIIVTDKSKLNIEETRKKINKWMDEDFAYVAGLELHYSAIPRKIIAEKYIDTALSSIELQAWCFNGLVKFISYETIKDTENPKRCVLYNDWKLTNFKISPNHYRDFEYIPQVPNCYEEFIDIAKKLANKFYHVRVDFIIYNNKLLFRELTFTSGSGLSKFEPKKAAYIVGNMLKLPCEK